MFYITVLLLSQFIEPSKFSPIVGGDVVKNDGVIKYPFMASLQLRVMKQNNNNEYKYEHFCGGSLLSPKWIISAAHCLWNKNITNIFAVIGYENIKKVIQEHRFAVERVEYFFFEPTILQNDIALLRLKKPYDTDALNFDKKYLFGKLPSYGMKAYRKGGGLRAISCPSRYSSAHYACKIIGFGATKHAGAIQEQLNEADVFVISNSRCQLLLGHVWAPQQGDRTVCALGRTQDTCQGDSGGPLLCKYNKKLYIYGIVSYGLKCDLSGVPSIYTITGPYIEWIKFITNE